MFNFVTVFFISVLCMYFRWVMFHMKFQETLNAAEIEFFKIPKGKFGITEDHCQQQTEW